jgi:hypothetical protein
MLVAQKGKNFCKYLFLLGVVSLSSYSFSNENLEVSAQQKYRLLALNNKDSDTVVYCRIWSDQNKK